MHSFSSFSKKCGFLGYHVNPICQLDLLFFNKVAGALLFNLVMLVHQSIFNLVNQSIYKWLSQVSSFRIKMAMELQRTYIVLFIKERPRKKKFALQLT